MKCHWGAHRDATSQTLRIEPSSAAACFSSLVFCISDRIDDRTSEFRINPSSAGLVSIAVSIIMGLDTHCGNDTAKRFLVEV